MNFVQDIHPVAQEDTQEGVEQRQHTVCAAKESSGEQVFHRAQGTHRLL